MICPECHKPVPDQYGLCCDPECPSMTPERLEAWAVAEVEFHVRFIRPMFKSGAGLTLYPIAGKRVFDR